MTLAINDYSHLSPEEARRKFIYIQNRLFTEQFQQNFYVKDIRSEVRLKYELAAYWEGRIQEMHGWDDVLGQLWDTIVDPLTDWMNSIWDSLIKPGVNAIVSGFKTIWDSAKSWAQSAYNAAYNAYSYAVNIYTQIVYNVITSINNIFSQISSLPSTLVSGVQQTISIVWTWLTQLWNNYIRPGVQTIIDAYKWYWNTAVNLGMEARNWAMNASSKITQVWGDLAEKVSGGFETVTKAMTALPQSIAAAFQSAISYMSEILKGVWDNVLVPFGQSISGAVQSALNSLGDAISSVLMSIWNFILNLGRLSPEAAESQSYYILKLVTLSAIGLGGATLAGEMLHPLKEIGLGRFAAMIYKATNYELITGMIIGAMARASIGQPARYAFNSKFRPFLPTWANIMEMYSRGKISRSEIKQYAAYYGYADEFMEFWDELKNSQVGYFALRQIAMSGFYDETIFKEEVQRLGYSKQAQDLMLKMLREQSYEVLRRTYEPVLLKRYEKGISDRQGFITEVKALNYADHIREHIIKFAELRRDTEYADDMIKALRHAYRQGFIDINTFQRELAKLGIDSEMIARYIRIEQAYVGVNLYQSQKEEVRATSKSIAIKRFREGLTTEDEFDRELRILGYSQEQRRLLIIYARLERDYDYAMQIRSALFDALKKGRITTDTFIQFMRSFGFTDEKIQLDLLYAQLKGYIESSE